MKKPREQQVKPKGGGSITGTQLTECNSSISKKKLREVKKKLCSFGVPGLGPLAVIPNNVKKIET